MKIIKMKLPEASVLFPDRQHYNYTDAYGGIFNDPEQVVGIDDLAHDFAQPPPRWVVLLMKFRDQIAGWVGLKKGSTSVEQSSHIPDRISEKMGFFRLFERTDHEIILGENDKHLDFRVSIFMEIDKNIPARKIVVVSTLVKYNNWMGPIYFFFVKPVHRLIVPFSLKRDFKKLDDWVLES